MANVVTNPTGDQTISSFNLLPSAANTTQSLGNSSAPWNAVLNNLTVDLGIYAPHSQLTPVTVYGMIADAIRGSTGSSTSGSATFTDSGANWKPTDVGKSITITGAALSNGTMTTTISTVSSSTSITLATNAGFTAANLNYVYGTDNTTALQNALNANVPLFLPSGQYFIVTGSVTSTGKIFFVGCGDESVLISDTRVFDVGSSANSCLFSNFRMENATVLTPIAPAGFPTTNAGTPVTVDRYGTGVGYQPTSNDSDIWSHVSATQQAQNIGPVLQINGANGSVVDRITGTEVQIIIYDANYCCIQNCNVIGGKGGAGGIGFWHTPSATGVVMVQNRLVNNMVRFASYSGVYWVAQSCCTIFGNHSEYNGESGLKNWNAQNQNGDTTYNSFNSIIGNLTRYNYYDGIDISEEYPHTNTTLANSVCAGNISCNNHNTGLWGSGQYWAIKDNVFMNNGLSGLKMDTQYSVISGNLFLGNNSSVSAADNQMTLGPTNNNSSFNIITNNTINGSTAQGASLAWGSGCMDNTIIANICNGGATFNFNGATPLISVGNYDGNFFLYTQVSGNGGTFPNQTTAGYGQLGIVFNASGQDEIDFVNTWQGGNDAFRWFAVPSAAYAMLMQLTKNGNLILPGNGINTGSINANGALTLNGATPTGSGSEFSIGNTTGAGNGTRAGISAAAKGTGSGPATPNSIVKWIEIDLGGTKYWIPAAQ